MAVAAVLTGSFSLLDTGGLFVVVAGGGVAFGLGVGWVVRQVRRRLDNPPAEITISLLTGYLAFIPADLLGLSAVLATVTAGVYLGWHTPELTSAQVGCRRSPSGRSSSTSSTRSCSSSSGSSSPWSSTRSRTSRSPGSSATPRSSA